MSPIQITYGIANCALIFFFIVQFKKRYIPSSLLVAFKTSLVWKVFLTVLGAALFYYYFPYQSDPKALYQAAADLRTHLAGHPNKISILWTGEWDPDIDYSGIPRAFFFIKLLFFMHLITGANYWTDSLWLSTFMFISSWVLCLKVYRISHSYFMPCLLALLFMPTTVFWSSGILKETIGLSALCWLLILFLQGLEEKGFPWKQLLWAFIPFYFLLNIRFYVLATFFLAAVPYYSASKYKSLNLVSSPLNYTLFPFALIMMGFLLNWTCQIVMHANLAELTFYTYEAYVTRHINDYNLPSLTTSFHSYWPYLPRALWLGLFSPQIWDCGSLLSYPEALLNTIVLSSLLFCFLHFCKNPKPLPLYVLAIIIYVAVSAICVAISSPNFGSLARYKTVYAPFLHFLILGYLIKQTTPKTGFRRFLAYFSGLKNGDS